MPDQGDAPFLGIALSEKVLLVTGKLKHLPKPIRRDCVVLSPTQFIV
jgi:hypothetical protein